MSSIITPRVAFLLFSKSRVVTSSCPLTHLLTLCHATWERERGEMNLWDGCVGERVLLVTEKKKMWAMRKYTQPPDCNHSHQPTTYTEIHTASCTHGLLLTAAPWPSPSLSLLLSLHVHLLDMFYWLVCGNVWLVRQIWTTCCYQRWPFFHLIISSCGCHMQGKCASVKTPIVCPLFCIGRFCLQNLDVFTVCMSSRVCPEWCSLCDYIPVRDHSRLWVCALYACTCVCDFACLHWILPACRCTIMCGICVCVYSGVCVSGRA